MDYIRITCARPGMRRAGLQHPARATYPASQFQAQQLERLRADPAFKVEDVEAMEEAVAPADAVTLLSAADLPTPRRIVMGVIRLMMPEAPEPLQAELVEALLTALDARTSGFGFQPVAQEIFARYARAIEAENSRAASDPDVSGRAPEASEASGTDSGSEAADAGAGSTDEAATPATKPARKPKSKA